MSEAEIEQNALNDDDNPPLQNEELAHGEFVTPEERKIPIYIRLDAEVIEHYKSGGAGYQTRINEDLLRIVRQKRVTGTHGSTRRVLSGAVAVRNGTWKVERNSARGIRHSVA